MKMFKFLIIFFVSVTFLYSQNLKNNKIAYIVSDQSIPFWKIMSQGIKTQAAQNGYEVDIYNSNNLKSDEIKNMVTALKYSYDGIILSPISSSSAKFLLKLANDKNMPVVISDIGTDGGKYVSYISSDNYNGAYELGLVLAKEMHKNNLQNSTVGIIAIPQKRENGKLRTKGFLDALKKYNIKTAGIKQQENFTSLETYNYAKELIVKNPDLKALWLQGSDKYQGALDAIKDTGNEGKILLICFDAEPEFLEMISKNELVGSAMQQPYVMGSEAFKQLFNFINKKDVKKEIKINILVISKENLNLEMKTIKKNVFGVED